MGAFKAIYITVNGERDNISGWSKKLGIAATYASRLHKEGVLVERIKMYLEDPEGFRSKNNKATNISVDGEVHNVSEWAKIIGLSLTHAYRLNQQGTLIKYIKEYKANPETFKGRRKYGCLIEPGTVIGRLTIQETLPERDKYGGKIARCICECGNECIVPYSRLRSSNPTRSCGCLQKETTRKALTKDLTGMTFGDLKVVRQAGRRGHFVCWEVVASNGKKAIVRGTDLISGKFTGKNALYRIKNIPDNRLGKMFKTYFRMNKEFDSWEEFETWALEKGYTEETTCKRLDTAKPYLKSNVYFEKRGSTFTFEGETKNLTEWAEILGISRERVRQLKQQGRLEEYIMTKESPRPSGRPRKLFKDTYPTPPAERNCKRDRARKAILNALDEPKTLDELFEISEFTQKSYFVNVVIAPLLADNLIEGRITGTRGDDDLITIEEYFHKVVA